VEHRLEHLRQLTPHPRRTVTPGVARPPRIPIPTRPRPDRDAHQPKPSPESAVPASESPPLRDRGISLLAIFTAATLLIVALVCLVGGVDRWWILIPVMVIDFAVTGVVIAVMVRLLDEGSGT
jgi:hypothetical protein